jgi:hypothetical protein
LKTLDSRARDLKGYDKIVGFILLVLCGFAKLSEKDRSQVHDEDKKE